MGKRAAAAPTEAQYAELTALVRERSGMVFAPNRRVEAEAGLARAMHQAGTADLAAYLSKVRLAGSALDALVDELRVGETHFMRDPDQMEVIRRDVLPALRGRLDRPPRVWSAGCASGEEAHSLAILLEEHGMIEGAVILGTDLSPAALGKARAGSYSDWSMRGVSARFLTSYFRHEGGRRILVDRIRGKARFERLNLVGAEDYATAGAGGMDLILCRNVLIYFSPDAVGRIAARLYDCLAPGGVLLTAGPDPLIGHCAPFEVEVTPAGLLYRRPLSARPEAVTPHRAAQHRTIPFPSRAPEEPAHDAASATPGPTSVVPSSGPDRAAFDQVVTLANGMGAFEAEVLAQSALRRFPLDTHLRYLRATLLLALGRDEDAEREAQRALYLDPSLAVAHFLLGTILGRRGRRPGALRAFRNARDLCAARPADEEVPAGSGERMGSLHSAAVAELERLKVTHD